MRTNCDIHVFPTLQGPLSKRNDWRLEEQGTALVIKMRWMSRNQLSVRRKTMKRNWLLGRTHLMAIISQNYSKVGVSTTIFTLLNSLVNFCQLILGYNAKV